MKKNILMTVMAVLVASLFSGCASNELRVSPSGSEYYLWDKGNDYSISMNSGHIIKTTSTFSDYKVALNKQLRIAALETRKMGYNYFVVTNSNINNLNGFPLNDANNLVRFISLKARKPSFATDGQERIPTSIISSGGMALRFKPVPASMLENGLISVWSVDKTLRDTK